MTPAIAMSLDQSALQRDAGRAALAMQRARDGFRLSDAEALDLSGATDLVPLMDAAHRLRDEGFGDVQTYSRKVFIPLTHLCRDSCHYCTFARRPAAKLPAYLEPEAVLDIARAGAKAGCKEALFTLGDKPELRYAAARDALARLGHRTTISYLRAMAERCRWFGASPLR